MNLSGRNEGYPNNLPKNTGLSYTPCYDLIKPKVALSVVILKTNNKYFNI